MRLAPPRFALALALVLSAARADAQTVLTPRALTAGPVALTPICAAGVTGTPVDLFGFAPAPPDTFYTRIDPQACGCPVAEWLTMAHVLLSVSFQGPLAVSAGIVQADMSEPSCPRPVPGAYLCAPRSGTVSPIPAGTWDLGITMANECCLHQTAFLAVVMEQAPSGTTFLTPGAHQACVSWDPTLADVSAYGNPLLFVDLQCCQRVDVRAGTWGALKAMYR